MLLNWVYRTEYDYSDWMHAQYMSKNREEGTSPKQSEEDYKADRRPRYHAVRRLREYFGPQDLEGLAKTTHSHRGPSEGLVPG